MDHPLAIAPLKFTLVITAGGVLIWMFLRNLWPEQLHWPLRSVLVVALVLLIVCPRLISEVRARREREDFLVNQLHWRQQSEKFHQEMEQSQRDMKRMAEDTERNRKFFEDSNKRGQELQRQVDSFKKLEPLPK
jgi:flagellar biosynthesis/type III secretory pathway M-ring protein FliF/YscJ